MYQSTLTFPNVLTLEEVASYLRFSQEVIEQLAQNGNIPGRKIGDSWRFLRSAIDEWLKGQSADTKPLDFPPDSPFISQVKQLSLGDKIQLLQFLATELDKTNEDIAPLEAHHVYHLPTPYNAFGAGQALMNAMNLP